MNDQTGKINWTDYTWNPITGCKHECPYCYAARLSHRLGRSFSPEFHPERLAEPSRVNQPSRVFVGSMADVFGDWVPQEWIDSVMAITQRFPQHTYQFLTKNPNRLAALNHWPSNCWAGTTVDTPSRLIPAINALRTVDAPVRFISFEPLNGDMGVPDFSGAVDWIIIGAQTGSGAHQPDEWWVEQLLAAAAFAHIPVLFKDNLEWPYRREEFPNHRTTPTLIPCRSIAQAPLPL
jgi:protein gp37